LYSVCHFRQEMHGFDGSAFFDGNLREGEPEGLLKKVEYA